MTVMDEDVVQIPDDGAEHSCACGHSGFRAWDYDDYLPGLGVVDDEGREVHECPGCGRELEAAPAA